MNIRTIAIMWIAAFCGALYASGWWAVAKFGWPQTGTWGVAYSFPTILATFGLVLFLVWSLAYALEKGDK